VVNLLTEQSLPAQTFVAALKINDKKAAKRPPFREKLSGLESANVLCLPTLLSFGYSEFNRLAVLQAAVSVRLDSGEMNENVFPVLA
jgi:hypothetical protein